MSVCAVFLCDKPYFSKFLDTCNQLIHTGRYKGDICLVIGDDMRHDDVLNCDTILANRIQVKHFPNFRFSDEFRRMQESLNRGPHWVRKLFQYHKLHLFDAFFKQWDYVFYLDCGIKIFGDVAPIIAEAKANTLLAHSDAYPRYEWKLRDQFDTTQKAAYLDLASRYNLNIDYFQTTMMLFDTRIIEPDTVENLRKLALHYPISITNDQGVIALYFTNIKPVFEQIRTNNETTNFYAYSMWDRTKPYIMTKM